MAKDYYAEIFFHFTWHTQANAPLITPAVESKLWNHIKAKCVQHAVHPIEVGGTPDHVHLVISAPPTVCVAELVGQLKGASSHFVNHDLRGGPKFAWQKGYGCLTLARRNVDALRRYVREQKTRHANGTTRETLERHLPEH